MANITNLYLWVQSRDLRNRSVRCSNIVDTKKSNFIVYDAK